jgi:Ni/Co efflux regulator RcnB
MNKLLSVIVAAVFTAASVTAIAQEKKTEKPKAEKSTTKKEPTAAQKKQKECTAQADDKKLKGDERKKFMGTCTKPAAKKGDAKPMKAEPKK